MRPYVSVLFMCLVCEWLAATPLFVGAFAPTFAPAGAVLLLLLSKPVLDALSRRVVGPRAPMLIGWLMLGQAPVLVSLAASRCGNEQLAARFGAHDEVMLAMCDALVCSPWAVLGVLTGLTGEPASKRSLRQRVLGPYRVAPDQPTPSVSRARPSWASRAAAIAWCLLVALAIGAGGTLVWREVGRSHHLTDFATVARGYVNAIPRGELATPKCGSPTAGDDRAGRSIRSYEIRPPGGTMSFYVVESDNGLALSDRQPIYSPYDSVAMNMWLPSEEFCYDPVQGWWCRLGDRGPECVRQDASDHASDLVTLRARHPTAFMNAPPGWLESAAAGLLVAGMWLVRMILGQIHRHAAAPQYSPRETRTARDASANARLAGMVAVALALAPMMTLWCDRDRDDRGFVAVPLDAGR